MLQSFSRIFLSLDIFFQRWICSYVFPLEPHYHPSLVASFVSFDSFMAASTIEARGHAAALAAITGYLSSEEALLSLPELRAAYEAQLEEASQGLRSLATTERHHHAAAEHHLASAESSARLLASTTSVSEDEVAFHHSHDALFGPLTSEQLRLAQGLAYAKRNIAAVAQALQSLQVDLPAALRAVKLRLEAVALSNSATAAASALPSLHEELTSLDADGQLVARTLEAAASSPRSGVGGRADSGAALYVLPPLVSRSL